MLKKDALDLLITLAEVDCESDSTIALRSLDTSMVCFDRAYYKKKLRAIRQYKKKSALYLPFSLRTSLFLCILVLTAMVIAVPLIPALFLLVTVVAEEEDRIYKV